tara:strand:+ start:26 stop:220 length:195 start_codon:yes stop_codon:yes gene_type:complete
VLQEEINMLRIRGNDIELHDKKIARLFDITAIDMQELRELIDKANNYDEDINKLKEHKHEKITS